MSQVPPLLVSVVTWWYWISSLRYWLVLGGTGSEQGSSGCQCDMLSENIWFTWCKPSNSSIFGEGKSDYGQTHTQTHRHTDRQNFLSKTRPLLWKGSSKNTFCNLNKYISKFGQTRFLRIEKLWCCATPTSWANINLSCNLELLLSKTFTTENSFHFLTWIWIL